MRRSPAVRKIAVLRALNLGDLLVAVPALRALRCGFPQAQITLISLAWAEAFARRFCRYVDRFVEFGGFPGINEVPIIPGQVERFLAKQRAEAYDLVIQMHGSGATSNPCALALGGRMTAGYYLGQRPDALAYAAPYPLDTPEVLVDLGLVGLLGCDGDPALEFPLFEDDRAEADVLLCRERPPRRPLVGIHAGSSTPLRRWPAASFARVADELARTHGAEIVLVGGAHERAITAEIARELEVRPVDLSGTTSLGGLAAVIARLDLFVGNDSGPAHVARAVGTPSVTIFGAEEVARWAPLDRTRHAVLVRPVEPDAVVAAAQQMLEKGAVACGA